MSACLCSATLREMRPGEALHRAGEDGARRAKRWLEATTRVKTVWLNTDGRHAGRMTFKWPHDPESYSFDLGGILHLGDFDGDYFVGESKKYGNANNNHGAEYRSFLAKCYATEQFMPAMYNHYMWITWHPFCVTDWSILQTPEYVVRGVLDEHKRVLGCLSRSEGEAKLDHETITQVASKLWMIVLSDKQEQLVITPENRKLVYGQAAEEGTL